MRLHREILPGAECAAYARHREPNLLQRQPEDTRQLLLVDVQPLGRDVEVDAALAVRNREPRLGAQRRLVLHADLVLALDHHVGARGLFAVADLDVPEQVAVWMQARRARGKRLLGVDDRRQDLVLDMHLRRRAPRLLGMVRGDERHRLSPVAHEVMGQDRLVLELETVQILPRHILVCEHSSHAGHRARGSRINRQDPRIRVRTAHGGAPKHALHLQVG